MTKYKFVSHHSVVRKNNKPQNQSWSRDVSLRHIRVLFNAHVNDSAENSPKYQTAKKRSQENEVH